MKVAEYDDYLADYKNQWCVSVEAILVRLLINKKISQRNYQDYKNFKGTQSKITIKSKAPTRAGITTSIEVSHEVS